MDETSKPRSLVYKLMVVGCVTPLCIKAQDKSVLSAWSLAFILILTAMLGCPSVLFSLNTFLGVGVGGGGVVNKTSWGERPAEDLVCKCVSHTFRSRSCRVQRAKVVQSSDGVLKVSVNGPSSG